MIEKLTLRGRQLTTNLLKLRPTVREAWSSSNPSRSWIYFIYLP